MDDWDDDSFDEPPRRRSPSSRKAPKAKKKKKSASKKASDDGEGMSLNPGGIIGGIVCGGLAFFLLFGVGETGGARRGVGKLVALAVTVGAAAGNFLWAAVVK